MNNSSRDVCGIRCPVRLQERPDILAVVSSSFLLCNVCLSLCLVELFASQRVSDSREGCHSLASSLAKSTRKSTRKSIQNRSRKTPRGTQNRPKIGPGTLSGRPVAPKSVPKGSRERPGSVSERPWRAPGAPRGFPRAPWEAKKGARERPGARRGDQNRRQVAPGSGKIGFSSRGSFAKRRRSDLSSMCVDFRQFSKI